MPLGFPSPHCPLVSSSTVGESGLSQLHEAVYSPVATEPFSALPRAWGRGVRGLLCRGPAGAPVPASRSQLPSCPHLWGQTGFQFTPESGGKWPPHPANMPPGWPPITNSSLPNTEQHWSEVSQAGWPRPRVFLRAPWGSPRGRRRTSWGKPVLSEWRMKGFPRLASEGPQTKGGQPCRKRTDVWGQSPSSLTVPP